MLALGFAGVAVGHFNGVPWLRWTAGQVMWWWPYELLGTFFLMLYLAFWEGLSDRLPGPRHRIILLATLFAGLAVILNLVFHLPLKALAISGLFLLPGYAPILAFGSAGERTRFLYRGGRSLIALIASFFVLGLVASLWEGPGVRAGGRAVFEGFAMVLWGAVYFLTKAQLEAANRSAAIRLNEGEDPRWGGGAGGR